MSIELMAHVWKQADVTGSELLVLLALADYANHDGVCFPSLSTLGEKARISRRQVIRVLQKLTERGLVEVIEQGGVKAGINRANVYKIRTDKMSLGGDNMTPGSVAHDTTGSVTHDTTVVSPMTPQSSLEPSYKPSSSSAPPTAPTQETMKDDDFKRVVSAMQRFGVLLNGYMAEQYQDMLMEFGLTAVLAGLESAAQNGKAGRLKYVRACVQSAYDGQAVKNGTAPVITLIPWESEDA